MHEALACDGYCLSCTQSLRGVVSKRCPECGRGFDPDDPRTMSPYAHGRLTLGLAALVRTVTLFAAALAGWSVLGSALGFNPLWMFFMAFSLLPLLLIALGAACLPIVPLTRPRRVQPFVFLAVIVSVLFTNWPLRLTFMAHRPWLEPIADQVLVDGTLEGPRWVGLYRFHRIIMHPSGNVGFQLTGRPGNGVHLVRREPGTRLIWWNAGTLADLGWGWELVDED